MNVRAATLSATHKANPQTRLRQRYSRYVSVLAWATLLLSPNAQLSFAAGICGDPPPVADEELKGTINGKANLLTKYFGQAELGGQVETARRDIFHKYPQAEAARGLAYFQYVVCSLLYEDNKLSTRQKLDEWSKIKDTLRPDRADAPSRTQAAPAPTIHQQSSGKCSPNTADVHGNVTISCN
jgi:hypothetical protein